MSADTNPQLTYRGKFIVRTVGAVLISACVVMVVLGVTVLAGQLQGPRYALYWSWCFLICAAALLVALCDMVMIRRAGRRRRRELFQQQFTTKDGRSD